MKLFIIWVKLTRFYNFLNSLSTKWLLLILFLSKYKLRVYDLSHNLLHINFTILKFILPIFSKYFYLHLVFSLSTLIILPATIKFVLMRGIRRSHWSTSSLFNYLMKSIEWPIYNFYKFRYLRFEFCLYVIIFHCEIIVIKIFQNCICWFEVIDFFICPKVIQRMDQFC